MEIGTIVNSRTYQASVAVLEDHDETADCICKVLRRDGKLVSVANTLDKFGDLIKGESKFDVCSIDWKINSRNVGSSALSLIRKYERDAGKVVYSVHKIEREAISGGADFVLGKKLDNYDEYLGEVEKAARLGLSRQIATRLAELDHAVKLSVRPSQAEQEALFRQSRSVALEKTKSRERDELHTLLKRRGWWQSFDAVSYSNLPTWEKLTLLLDCVGAGADDVAQIFQCSLTDAQRILEEKKVASELADSADELLSVLAYLLRLSKDETALMPHYWTASNLFAGSLSSPPWDASGMYEYLRSGGKAGIENALDWIRSH
jgi:CheY-like chemotaxis protein